MRVPGGPLNDLVVIVRNANEDGEVGASFKIEEQARIFDRLPRRFQEQPVLRINVGRLARRDAEKLLVELVNVLDEATAPGDGFPENSRLCIIKTVEIPTIRRHIADSLTALAQEFPKRFGVINPARKSTTDSDDSNAVLRHLKLKDLMYARHEWNPTVFG